MDGDEKNTSRLIRVWKRWTIALGVLCLTLIIAVIVVALVLKNEKRALADTGDTIGSTPPCPATNGGLITSGDPEIPSSFHDLTMAEYARMYDFLGKQQALKLAPLGMDKVNASNIYTVDLLMPPKRDVLSFLDNQGNHPAREAVVTIFRGDKTPPVEEE